MTRLGLAAAVGLEVFVDRDRVSHERARDVLITSVSDGAGTGRVYQD